MTEIISCPYCYSYGLREPEKDEDKEYVKRLMTEHCREEHLDDIIWDIIEQKISNYK